MQHFISHKTLFESCCWPLVQAHAAIPINLKCHMSTPYSHYKLDIFYCFQMAWHATASCGCASFTELSLQQPPGSRYWYRHHGGGGVCMYTDPGRWHVCGLVTPVTPAQPLWHAVNYHLGQRFKGKKVDSFSLTRPWIGKVPFWHKISDTRNTYFYMCTQAWIWACSYADVSSFVNRCVYIVYITPYDYLFHAFRLTWYSSHFHPLEDGLSCRHGVKPPLTHSPRWGISPLWHELCYLSKRGAIAPPPTFCLNGMDIPVPPPLNFGNH